MKAAFFSLATLAFTAFAAPSTPAPRDAVSDAVHELEDLLLGDLGLGEIVDGATKSPVKRGIESGADLISVLESGLSGLKENTANINSTISQVQDGSMTKDAAADAAADELKDIQFKLSDILQKILNAAGLNVSKTDLNKVLTLVVALVSELLFTVKTLLTILGIRPQLASILHSVFGLLSNILAGLIGLLGALLPGLIAALTPLLAGLGNGLLAPLLTGVAGLLAGLSLGQ